MLRKVFNHLKWRYNQFTKITYRQWALSRSLPAKVLSGPFKGMSYLKRGVGSVILPKLIGTYEAELHPYLNALKEQDYYRFIDVGGAEGYYAVGIKKYLLPNVVETIVYEMGAEGRKLIEKLAAMNGVRGITIKGNCNKETLASDLDGKRSFILVDVEGYEYELLNPKEIDFQNCDILVELHGEANNAPVNRLVDSFSGSHDAQFIGSQEKKLPSDIDFPPEINANAAYAVDEFRSASERWLFLKSGNTVNLNYK